VKVTVDGKLVTEELGARAVPLDPGKRSFRFDSADHGSKELEVVLREGEKNRTVAVSFEPAKAAVAPAPVAPTPSRSQPPSSDGPPTAFWVLGGAGVAAVAVGAVFEIMGLSKKSDLEECKPRCSASDADAMTRNFVIGDIALVSGGVALGAALVVLLTDDDAPAHGERARRAGARRVTVGRFRGAQRELLTTRRRQRARTYTPSCRSQGLWPTTTY
jgi:hypothetical protein